MCQAIGRALPSCDTFRMDGSVGVRMLPKPHEDFGRPLRQLPLQCLTCQFLTAGTNGRPHLESQSLAISRRCVATVESRHPLLTLAMRLFRPGVAKGTKVRATAWGNCVANLEFNCGFGVFGLFRWASQIWEFPNIRVPI